MRTKKLAPIHPGEHLAGILKESGITANALALRLRVPANRITTIIQGKRSITAETALRGTVLWNLAPVLDEFADQIRFGLGARCSS